ncbi:MAG: hypothetical protein ACK5L5_06405 [Bacteroidales bacterium]
MYRLIFKIIFSITIVCGVQLAKAQSNSEELIKQVEVVKEFDPEAMEVFKIESFPTTDKSTNKPTNFEYDISASPYTSAEGSINPIAPAKMTGLPNNSGNYGYVRLGLGNYSTPYGEIFLNSKNKKHSKLIFGAHAKHLSSRGGVNLLDGPKVEPAYSNNTATLFGKYGGNKFHATLALDFCRNRADYYGWSNSMHETILPLISASTDDILSLEKNTFTKYGASLLFGNNSISNENNGLNYDIGMSIHVMDLYSGQTETHSKIKTDINTKMNDFTVGAQLALENADMKDIFGGTKPSGTTMLPSNFDNNKSTVYVSPYLKKQVQNVDIYVGINTAFNFENSNIDTAYVQGFSYANFFIAPDLKLAWQASEKLNVNARLSGEQNFGYMGGIVEQIPYVNPTQLCYAPNTNRYFAEISGKYDIISPLELKLSINYSVYTDKAQYVYGASPVSLVGLRTFALQKDDFNNLEVDFQLTYKFSEVLQASGAAQLIKSSGKIFEKDAYNPNLSLLFSGRYNKNGIYVSPQFRFVDVGTAYAFDYENRSSKYKKLDIDNILDLSIEGGYEIMERFSVFCRLNNLLFQDYEFWYGYTNQSFNGLLGLSYVF